MSSITDLASAIVAQAAKDYIKILRKLWKKGMTVQVTTTYGPDNAELLKGFQEAKLVNL